MYKCGPEIILALLGFVLEVLADKFKDEPLFSQAQNMAVIWWRNCIEEIFFAS